MFYVPRQYEYPLRKYIGIGVAEWEPSEFGDPDSMLVVRPVASWTADDLRQRLDRHHIRYYTEFLEAESLDEADTKSAPRPLKGIFIDRDTGNFRIISGKYPDKKAMIQKYGAYGKDYIARKVFEKPVFDWILKNAQNNLDAYLLFSTAFSKWQDSDQLKDYYYKIINDLPQLFRDKQEGDDLQEVYHTTAASTVSNRRASVEIRDNTEEDAPTKSAPDIVFQSDDNTKYNNPSVVNEVLELLSLHPKASGAWISIKNARGDVIEEEFWTRERAELGVIPEEQRHINTNHDSRHRLDKTQELFVGYVTLRDHDKNKIDFVKGPLNPNIIEVPIEKENGINDFEIWAALDGIMKAYPHAAFAYLRPKGDDTEWFTDRETVERMKLNTFPMNANNPNFKPLPAGKWRKSNINKVMAPKTYSHRGGDKNYIRQHQPIESTMTLREKILALKEEMLPDVDLLEPVNHVVALFVKNPLGRDDREVVMIAPQNGVELEPEDFANPDIDAAAARLKQRNPGRKIWMQINDEPEQPYIDFE